MLKTGEKLTDKQFRRAEEAMARSFSDYWTEIALISWEQREARQRREARRVVA